MPARELEPTVSRTSPSAEDVDITAADHTFTSKPRALYIGAAGDLVVHMRDDAGGTNHTFKALVAGTVLPVSPDKIIKNGSSAAFAASAGIVIGLM